MLPWSRAIRSTIRSCCTIAVVSSSLAASVPTAVQFTSVPSEIDAAASSSGSSDGLPTGHLLREAHQRAADRHVRGANRRLAEQRRELGVREAELDAPDDRLPVIFAEARER